MANGERYSHEFYDEATTLPITDFETVANNKTQHPFKSNLGPQAAIAKNDFSINKENAKFTIVERTVHGRSIDEKATSSTVLWGGEFPADKFGARDLKGAREENAVLIVSERAPRKDNQKNYRHIRIKGLYDETELDYLTKASEYLRSKGIPTEKITAIYKPNQIAFNGELVSEEEWRKLVKTEFAERMEDKGIDDPELLQEALELVDTTQFYQVERELQVSERIRDLSRCTDETEFRKVLENPLKWINVATQIKHEGIIPGSPQPEKFDINNEADIERFLCDWLPSQMGTYLGKLKNAGIKNDFAHAQQWSLAATLYDSQSFVGEALDGQKLDIQDHLASLKEALSVLEELFDSYPPNYVVNKYGNLIEKAKENLLINYFSEIDIKNDPDAGGYSYESLCVNTFYNGSRDNLRMLNPVTFVRAKRKMGYTYSEKRIDEMYKTRKDTFNEISLANKAKR